MLPMIFSMLLTFLPCQEGRAKSDAQLLIDTIESLQQPVEDFRCDFEGTIYHKGKVAEDSKVGEDGLYKSFSGTFIWKKGGDIHSESLVRRATDGQVARESLIVRMRQQQAEEYHRLDDAPIGYAVIKNPKEVKLWRPDCMGYIFLVDEMKREVAAETYEASVSDDQIEGRPLKVLSIALKFKHRPSSMIGRYWIDLRRNGHVVRVEGYQSGNVMSGRLDIKLAPFRIRDAEVWMPVSGKGMGYVALVDKKVVITKEPTSINSIYVLGGTMQFNNRPGPEVFTIKYKFGTPISDNLRKLEYEFGQQRIGLQPNKVDAENMLKEQIVKAEEQKAELVVASPSESFDWTSWLSWGFGGFVLISSVALWIQRRGH